MKEKMDILRFPSISFLRVQSTDHILCGGYFYIFVFHFRVFSFFFSLSLSDSWCACRYSLIVCVFYCVSFVLSEHHTVTPVVHANCTRK